MDRTRGHISDVAVAMAYVQKVQHLARIWEPLNERQIHAFNRAILDDQRGRLTYDELKDRLNQIALDHTTGDHRWIRNGAA